MSTKLHVGNISSAVAVADLKAVFSHFGPVDTVEIARDSGTGLSKGFATVMMSRDEDAAVAIGRLNLTQYVGRTIGVSRLQATEP
jgi:RNA recognition motif-containing protein